MFINTIRPLKAKEPLKALYKVSKEVVRNQLNSDLIWQLSYEFFFLGTNESIVFVRGPFEFEKHLYFLLHIWSDVLAWVEVLEGTKELA